jgi:hypothetical protein
MTGVPNGKHLLFKTLSDDDCSLIMYNDPNKFWIPDEEPIQIRVEVSGIIIDNATSRVYIGKSNATVFNKLNDKIHDMKIISKSASVDNIKIKNIEVETVDSNVDFIKLTVKSISAKLYNIIKDMNEVTEIKTAIVTFMSTVKDINHLIKLDKELMMQCSL